MDTFIQGGIFGAVIAGIVLLVGIFMRPKLACAECERELPRFRKPANFQQFMWGGQTCPNCGTELNGKGQKKAG